VAVVVVMVLLSVAIANWRSLCCLRLFCGGMGLVLRLGLDGGGSGSPGGVG